MPSNKSNKSFLKRVKVTKNGKLISRRAGQNHFNAKESRRTQLGKKRSQTFTIANKARSLYFAHSN